MQKGDEHLQGIHGRGSEEVQWTVRLGEEDQKQVRVDEGGIQLLRGSRGTAQCS